MWNVKVKVKEGQEISRENEREGRRRNRRERARRERGARERGETKLLSRHSLVRSSEGEDSVQQGPKVNSENKGNGTQLQTTHTHTHTQRHTSTHYIQIPTTYKYTQKHTSTHYIQIHKYKLRTLLVPTKRRKSNIAVGRRHCNRATSKIKTTKVYYIHRHRCIMGKTKGNKAFIKSKQMVHWLKQRSTVLPQYGF